MGIVPPSHAELAHQLEAEVRADIPLLAHMGFSIRGRDGGSVEVRAPLAPNVNDKGCAFGGSLVSLMTVAGWAVARLAFDARGLAGDLFVADSEVRYLAPVWEEIRVRAVPAEDADLEGFAAEFAENGKARIAIVARVLLADGTSAATLAANFVALRPR